MKITINRMPKDMDIKRARELFAELKEYLWNNRSESLYHPYINASNAVKCLSMEISEAEKAEAVKTFYRLLFPARGGLTDIVLWDPDYEVRKALNEPITRIEKELYEIVRSDGDIYISYEE